MGGVLHDDTERASHNCLWRNESLVIFSSSTYSPIALEELISHYSVWNQKSLNCWHSILVWKQGGPASSSEISVMQIRLGEPCVVLHVRSQQVVVL